MNETKSWGSGDESKTAHALFICLTQNLLIFLEQSLFSKENIANHPEINRREHRKASALKNGAPFVATFLQHCTVRSVKFLRWVRNHVYREIRFSVMIGRAIGWSTM